MAPGPASSPSHAPPPGRAAGRGCLVCAVFVLSLTRFQATALAPEPLEDAPGPASTARAERDWQLPWEGSGSGASPPRRLSRDTGHESAMSPGVHGHAAGEQGSQFTTADLSPEQKRARAMALGDFKDTVCESFCDSSIASWCNNTCTFDSSNWGPLAVSVKQCPWNPPGVRDHHLHVRRAAPGLRGARERRQAGPA